MKQKVIKAGNSKAVTIPSDFVHKVGIKAGDSVLVNTDLEKGKVIYTFSGVRQLALNNSLLKGQSSKLETP